MTLRTRKLFLIGTCVVGLAAVAGSFAAAQPAKDARPGTTPGAPAAQPEIPLPPGWTTEDMQACTRAGMPGEMHEYLKKSVGVWRGKTQMWMAPGTEPVRSECTWTVSSLFDGRYTRSELAAEFPGMGAFSGIGITGFDNVSRKFVGSWIDSHNTGIMNGVGELSADGKVLSWNYTYNCAIRKKPAVVREVHTSTGADTMTFEMFATDPKSGKEYQCMRVEFTRGV